MPTSTLGLVNPAELKRGPNMADVAKLAGVKIYCRPLHGAALSRIRQAAGHCVGAYRII